MESWSWPKTRLLPNPRLTGPQSLPRRSTPSASREPLRGSRAHPSGGSQPLPAASTGSSGSPNMILWLFPVIAFMLLMTMMTGRKDKKKKAEMMSSLKKQDKVQMIGGEIGTIAEITDDEVVLRVEEGRIRFARSAVQTVLVAKNKPESTTISELKGEAKTTSV